MKVTSFHFMPYRDLPEDFPRGLASAWVDAPWWEYGDADKVTDFYNWSIDELMLAAKLGFDGVGTNEHHQNPYGFMCNPNLFGAILAKMTRDQGLEDVALVQLGATLAATSPPIRGSRRRWSRRAAASPPSRPGSSPTCTIRTCCGPTPRRPRRSAPMSRMPSWRPSRAGLRAPTRSCCPTTTRAC